MNFFCSGVFIRDLAKVGCICCIQKNESGRTCISPLAIEYCCPGFILNLCAFAKPNNNIYWILPCYWALNFTFSNLCWWDTAFWIGTLLA